MYFTPERRTRLAEKLFAHVRESSTDQVAETLEYDLSIYSDPELAVAERARIFERLPMMALHASQVAEPNSFARVRLNRSDVVVTRLRDGSLRALVNACRHRGAHVVTEDRGKRPAFTCPYH